MEGGKVIFTFDGNTKPLDKSIKDTSSKFGDLGNIIKGTAIGSLVSQGVQKAVNALGNLGKSSLDAMANYEQLVGGIDTLFKGSSQTVQKYASNAFKTAGVSANRYMELATSFSASLISSLGGDTAKATKTVDMAITDMSDNVNKMGSTMESVQYAYQGFAKQNYTMLDNLKLGYGGTKSEMERLLQDAEKLSGVHYDISNLNDVYNAIHVIQTQMGITGTTAKEAEGTISGSINMVKASFQDLISGEGSPKAFTDSITTAMNNIVPAITKIAPTIVNGIVAVMNAITPILPGLIQKLLPSILNSITLLVGEIVKNLPAILSAIWQGITSAFSQFSTGTKAGIGLIGGILGISKVASFISKIQPIIGIIKGIVTAIKGVTIAQTTLNIVMNANPIGLIITAIGLLVAGFILLWNKSEGFRNFWIGLWDAICSIVKTVVGAIVKFFSGIIDFFKNNWPTILLFAINPIAGIFKVLYDKCEGFRNFVNGFLEGVKSLFTSAINGIVNAFKWLGSGISNIITGAVIIFRNFINFVRSIPGNIVNIFKSLPRQMLNIGTNLVKGLWNGIKNVTGWILGKIKGFGKAVLNGMKKIFGVNSPSTKFAWIGKMNGEGLIKGIEDIQPEVQGAIDGMFDLSPNLYNNASANLSPNVNVYNDVNVSTDPLGQVVKNIKTYSGGSKNDYNYGMGV